MNPTGSSDFSETHWTAIGHAASNDPHLRHPALDKLAASYLRSLHQFLVVKKRIPEHDADEIVQDFLLEKLLGGQLLQQADRNKGKFRALLVRSLENFLIDRFRRLRDKLPVFEFQEGWDAAAHEALCHFNVEWARERLAACLQRMREECERSNRSDLWQVFDERLVQKLLHGRTETTYEELQQRFGWTSRKQAADRLVTAQRMWARLIRQEIAEFCDDPDSIEEEVRDLIDTLLSAARRGYSLVSTPQAGVSAELQTSEEGSATLLGIDESSAAICSAADLASQVAHQLQCSLAEELSANEFIPWQSVAELTASSSPPITTFQDLFEHPQPSVQLLQLVKDFAKESTASPRHLLPQSVADFLYVTSLLAAVAQGESISAKSPLQIQMDALVLQRQQWIPPEACDLLQRLATRVAARPTAT